MPRRKNTQSPPFVRTTVALDPRDLDAMRAAAHADGMLITAWMRDVLVDALQARAAARKTPPSPKDPPRRSDRRSTQRSPVPSSRPPRRS